MANHSIRRTPETAVNLTKCVALAAVLSGAMAVQAQPDYGPAIWRPVYSGHWYTSGNGHKFVVIHDMEGYYLSTISYFQQSGTQASVHYYVNGVKDSSSDAPAGEISQGVREAYYAWHALCWNTHSAGTEHEGFASNPAWYTEAMYQASAGLQRHLCDAYGIVKDRNHIVAHGQKSVPGWSAWAGPNLGIDPNCNSHTDPGPNWDWNHFMSLINVQNPPWVFNTDTQGWSLGNSLTALGYNNSGWPGIIYADQVGNDAFYYSPPTSYTGQGQGLINVSVYPQGGTTANHDMQIFYKTAADNTWTASKSSPVVNYTAQNGWIRLNLDLNSGNYAGQTITQIRLDVDANNSGTRWIVNHVIPQSALRWYFDSNAMGWTPGNGVSGITWYNTGWPGIIYFDQTGNDAFIYSATSWFDNAGPYKYLGGANDRIHVRVYPQNGNTANHDMQVFWTTTNDGTWTESKSVSVNYTGQNQWVDVYLPVGTNPNWNSANNATGGITQLRLDFDAINHGNRWIVDSITMESN
ncbi:MAG: hypothetical protein JWQ71_4930 [Pedosphaera sp.]|nr:hypothetical protein [Pedosphaera sp.]